MKQFVDVQGNVYRRGVQLPQLRGTIQPTQVVLSQKKPKVSAREKQQNMLNTYAKINQLKNEIMSAYQNKDKKKAHRLQRQLNVYKKQTKNILKKIK